MTVRPEGIHRLTGIILFIPVDAPYSAATEVVFQIPFAYVVIIGGRTEDGVDRSVRHIVVFIVVLAVGKFHELGIGIAVAGIKGPTLRRVISELEFGAETAGLAGIGGVSCWSRQSM